MSVAAIAAVARQLEVEAQAKVEALALDAGCEISGIAAAFNLHDCKYWNAAAAVDVAGALLRLVPEAGPELAYAAVAAWHRGRGGVLDEGDDDIGEERGSA